MTLPPFEKHRAERDWHDAAREQEAADAARRLGGGDTIKATLNPTFKSDVGHPCPKPVELLKGLILKTKAQSVIDPFMGSGTTLVAAKAVGIRAVGIEQSERYCAVAADRLRQGTLDFSSPEGVDPTTAATAAPPSGDDPPPWCSWRSESRPVLGCALVEGHVGPHAEYVLSRQPDCEVG